MRGFTLLELMTTLAIFGVVAALSVTSLGPLKDRYSHQQAVEMVSASIVRAQLLARQSGRCHLIRAYNGAGPNLTGHILHIQRRVSANCGDGIAAADFETVETVTLPKGTTFSIPLGSEVELRPNGRKRVPASAEVRVFGAQPGQVESIMVVHQGIVCVGVTATVGTCP
jgi:prepilin-type N-terminal cleavage/methylation domain-containing protein